MAWLLGKVWLVAGQLLRRCWIRVLRFIAAAGIVVLLVWPGSSSDYAVPVNRIVVPLVLALLAVLPLLVRRYYGPVRQGLLPRTVRVVGYLVVLAVIAGNAVQEREGQKLGAYFGDDMAATAMIDRLIHHAEILRPLRDRPPRELVDVLRQTSRLQTVKCVPKNQSEYAHTRNDAAVSGVSAQG